jgi:pilus assembly protein CpaF
MSMAFTPAFGRRNGAAPAAPMPRADAVSATPSSRPDLAVAAMLPPTAADAAITELRNVCLARLEPNAVAAMPADRLITDVERLISEIATEKRVQLNAREQRALAGELVNDILGLGPLEALLADDSIADIMINGPDRIFIERLGKTSKAHIRFRDQAHLINICQRIASEVGRRIDESSPMVDARLKDGSRVNIVFPPLALDGPYVSIRKFGKKPIDFARLVAWGALTNQVARVLEIAGKARLNIVVSGGTGSGKTTMMNALSRNIDHNERVITVEDAAELQFQQPHVVRLETRPSSLEGRGEINQRDLVRNALRMRPDRIIIGEVRGAEAFDMLQAMNTGHDGSMSTIHSNNTRDALTRIENMVQMGNMGLPSKAIRTQIVGAVDLIIQVERQRDGGRRVTQVTEVCGMEGEVITLNDIFQLEILGENAEGRLYGRYKVSRVPPSFLRRLSYFGLDRAWKAAIDEDDA